MRRQRNSPGILNTMARTAVIAGTANATVGVMNSKAAAKQNAAHQQAAAAQAAADEVAATQARLAALEQQATPGGTAFCRCGSTNCARRR